MGATAVAELRRRRSIAGLLRAAAGTQRRVLALIFGLDFIHWRGVPSAAPARAGGQGAGRFPFFMSIHQHGRTNLELGAAKVLAVCPEAHVGGNCVATCWTKRTMQRRRSECLICMNALTSDNPSDVATKSET